ncbi:hypothetical protein ABK040_008275 [Willaertia magna]
MPKFAANVDWKSYFVRKPAIQLGFIGFVLSYAFVANRIQYSAQGKIFNDNLPKPEMWAWYNKHSVRCGENRDMVLLDYAENQYKVGFGKFDRKDDSENPFKQARQ